MRFVKSNYKFDIELEEPCKQYSNLLFCYGAKMRIGVGTYNLYTCWRGEICC